MASENAPIHTGQCEEREPGHQEKAPRCAHGNATNTQGCLTTADPPRHDAIRSRGPDKRSSSVPLYCFPPLRKGYIRLLRLMPHHDQHASIQCQLIEHLFDDPLLNSRKGTHLYEALSYVWGSEDKRQSISIDEGCLCVTENLHAALLRLRDHSLPRLIWIDAICIDQENTLERNLQVQQMAKIYARASRVIVWLEEETAGGDQVDGEATTNGDRALEVIGNAAAQGRPTEFPRNDQEAVRTLLQRSWFQRIWVLQEVAAARHVVVISRTIEIDGYAFCLGCNILDIAPEEPDTQSRIHSTTYLIKDAVLRPKHATSHSDKFSLHIRPLGELIDMYHDRKATDLRDKVYALLGMSSDLPVGMTPNYNIRWKELFCHLVKSLIGDQATVETWDEEEIAKIAVIKSKGCVLGEVSKKEDTRGDEQRVDITWKSYVGTEGKQISNFTFPASAKPIREGDTVCLLKGASKPTIVRVCDGYSAVIMISAPLPENSQPTSIKSITTFPNDMLLVWDWDVSQGKPQDRGYEHLLGSQEGPKCPRRECKCQDYMDKATRQWNIGLLLNGMERYEEAGKNLRKALEFYGTAVGSSHGPWGEADKETLRVMDFLLMEDKGTAIEAKCKDGQTPLSWAAGNGHKAVVQLLLNKGAGIDTKDNMGGQTPLLWAARNGHKAVVQLLLNKGAGIDTKDNMGGQTPLLWAARNGHKAVVQLLLDKGAGIDIKDDIWDQTPLLWAVGNGHKGAGIDTKDNIGGQTPLSWAARNGHKAVVQLLLNKGAGIDTKDNMGGRTPLSWAAGNGHEAVVQLLLNKGAGIDTMDNMGGQTPLSWAARNGHEAVVQLLLNKGAGIDTKDNMGGQTPLLWAAGNGHDAVVRLLQMHADTATASVASVMHHVTS